MKFTASLAFDLACMVCAALSVAIACGLYAACLRAFSKAIQAFCEGWNQESARPYKKAREESLQSWVGKNVMIGACLGWGIVFSIFVWRMTCS